MKIECELCHATAELGELAPRAGGMDVRCSVCHGWFFVRSGPPAAEPPATPADVAPESLCPKCGRPRAQGESCPRCGLRFELWEEQAAAGSAAMELDAVGSGLWAELERDWGNQARHDAFLEHCRAGGQLSAAGRRYRERLDRNPSDQLAAKMQDRIITMAVQLLGPHGTAPLPVTRSRGFWVTVVCAAVGAAIAAFLSR